MNFAGNLHYLRKRDKVTQEDLADKLGVSRQSVSKWETGEAYPETDKLILLCDIFKVSLDELVRIDLTAASSGTGAESPISAPTPMSTPTPSAQEHDAHMNKFSIFIALGVFFVLLGVAGCVALSGYGTTQKDYENIYGILGAVCVISFVALAVFLFIFAGIRHDHYRKAHPSIPNLYSEIQLRAFEKRFAICMASLIAGILVDVVFLVTLTALIEENIITGMPSEAAQCLVVAAFLMLLAFLVGGIVYMGIQHSKYHVEEYNREAQEQANPPKGKKLKDVICGIIMLSAAAVYLLIGFVANIWHPSWVIFPVCGIICGIISMIFEAKK